MTAGQTLSSDLSIGKELTMVRGTGGVPQAQAKQATAQRMAKRFM
jgi:hypothetical protein